MNEDKKLESVEAALQFEAFEADVKQGYAEYRMGDLSLVDSLLLSEQEIAQGKFKVYSQEKFRDKFGVMLNPHLAIESTSDTIPGEIADLRQKLDAKHEADSRAFNEMKLRAETAEARLAAVDETPAGSHHGDPILTKRDISLLEAHAEWMKILISEDARKTKERTGFYDEQPILPHYPDWIKSRLFWRIRSGKKPLKYAPPTAYSCPWYEVIEVPGPHDNFELVCEREGKAYVAQCGYKVLGHTPDGKLKLGFGPYRFVAWNGPVTRKRVEKGVITEFQDQCCWIEYTGIEETPDAPK